MKKIIALILVVIFACFGLCGCKKEPTLTERIAENNKAISNNTRKIQDIDKNLQDLSKAIKGLNG